jgi:hypothetical protein
MENTSQIKGQHMKEELTTQESDQLKRHEAVIKAGKNTFVAVGMALTDIRERRLYRQDYDTFEAYCQMKWGWSRQRASQMIQAAVVVKQLPENLSTRVDTEKAARALAKVPEDKRAKVVAAATKDGRVTTKAVKNAIKDEEAEEEIRDVDGVKVPKALRPLWNRSNEVAAVLWGLSTMKSKLKQAQENDDPLWRQVNFSAVLGDLQKAWTGIHVAKPYAVCPQCQGHPDTQPKGNCRLCLGVGIIGKFRYQAVDKKLLEVRKKALVKK